jgi:hypothetical protein
MILPEFSLKISASTVSWYGAIVATIAGAVSIYNAWKDRARIKIKYEPGMFIVGGSSRYKDGVKHLSISVINKGRRPIRIEQAYLRDFDKDKEGLVLTLPGSFYEERPRVITEESPTTTFITQQDKLNLERIYCVVIVDGAGRKYKKYVKSFPTFKRLYYKISSVIKT